jgi:uncharacterized membrane protein
MPNGLFIALFGATRWAINSVLVRANGGLTPLLFIALFGALSQFFIYLALNYSPASRVVPLYSTNVLLVFMISFLINRKLELFTVKIFFGMLAVVLGAFFVFQ